MGAKQSSPGFDGRTRAYSSSDLPSGNTSGGVRVAGFRYTNGPDGPRIRYTGGRPTSSGLSIPAGSHVLNQSLDGTGGDEESELPPEGHRLLIGSLPAHLSPHLLGGKCVTGKPQPLVCNTSVKKRSHRFYVLLLSVFMMLFHLLSSSLFLSDT